MYSGNKCNFNCAKISNHMKTMWKVETIQNCIKDESNFTLFSQNAQLLMAQFMPTVYSAWKLLEAVVFAYLYLLHVHQHLHSKCRVGGMNKTDACSHYRFSRSWKNKIQKYTYLHFYQKTNREICLPLLWDFFFFQNYLSVMFFC